MAGDAPTFIVADDHPLFRHALRQIVEPHFAGARIVEAGTLDEAAAAIEAAVEPDLVLFDLTMPGARGFSGLMYLRAQYPRRAGVRRVGDRGCQHDPPSRGAGRRGLHPEIFAAGDYPRGDPGHSRRRDVEPPGPTLADRQS